MKSYCLAFLLMIASFSQLSIIPLQSTQPKKEFIIIDPYYPSGLFSRYLTVLGFLEHFENGHYAGLNVNFEDRGFYYDPEHGPNWWQYYFDPLYVGSTNNAVIKRFNWEECSDAAYFACDNLTRERAFELIKKYIRPRAYIKEEVEAFIDSRFQKTYTIGIHYRGTDKITEKEALFISYSNVLEALLLHINENQIAKFKIFIATDEQPFLDYMKARFPRQVIYQEATRSENDQAIHIGNTNPYQIGKEAVIDALLLSRCDFLIRTWSNLSLCSTFFNPKMPVHVLE